MKKLRLALDDLRVSSFATNAAGAAPRGTVLGHRAVSGVSCIAYSCDVGYCEPQTSLEPVQPEPGGETQIC